MNLMRIISMSIIVFCLLAGACASQGHTNKTKISRNYHKKEHNKNQANINSLQYSTKKRKKNKQGFFGWLFPGKKSYYASQ
jgi:hypothetical protein